MTDLIVFIFAAGAIIGLIAFVVVIALSLILYIAGVRPPR